MEVEMDIDTDKTRNAVDLQKREGAARPSFASAQAGAAAVRGVLSMKGMTSSIQPALDGSIPVQENDFETWVTQVRPAFEQAAATGREFASWHIKVDAKLPEPPNPKSQWGALMHRFSEEGLVEAVSFTTTRDGSGVRTWRGTRTARTQRRAA